MEIGASLTGAEHRVVGKALPIAAVDGEFPLGRSAYDEARISHRRRNLVEIISRIEIGDNVAESHADIGVERALGTEPDETAQVNRDLGDGSDRQEAVVSYLVRLLGSPFPAACR